MRTKVADPQIIAREGIFLNQELLDLGLAKLYKDPSSAPLDKLGTSSPRKRPQASPKDDRGSSPLKPGDQLSLT